MKKVITYGTFDLFHVGHVRLLKRLSLLGDEVLVGCSTDEFNTQKGKKCVVPFSERVEVLNACKYVSKVFPEDSWDQKVSDIQRVGADIFAMGSDWEGKFEFLKSYCTVIYLPRTDRISTTEIKFRTKQL